MTSPDRSSEDLARTGLLSSHLVARMQNVATRLRVLLAVPALLVLFIFTDRSPMWPGMAVALAGEAFQLWATAHLRKNILLVKSGPYGWVRNPMYFGRFFVGLGLTLLTWRWFVIIPYVIIYALYAQARVLQEERRLRDLFGAEYADYCAAVNRWFARPPRRKLSPERWSWAAVFRNHELRVAGGVVVVLVTLHLRLTVLGPLWSER
jgi:protein-S-isoprenylcysteine O-methyltransferase Ste14